MATFFAGRFIVWSSLFIALGLPTALYKYTKTLNYKPQTFLQNKFSYFTLISILGIVCICSFSSSIDGECAKLKKAQQFYLSYIHSHKNTKVLNDDLIGSCLISKSKVFIDSRFDFYGSNFVKSWREDFLMGQNFQNYLNKWQPNLIFIQKNWPIYSILKVNSGFPIIYEDGIAVILIVK